MEALASIACADGTPGGYGGGRGFTRREITKVLIEAEEKEASAMLADPHPSDEDEQSRRRDCERRTPVASVRFVTSLRSPL